MPLILHDRCGRGRRSLRGPTSRGIASAGPFVVARERGDEGGCGSPVGLQIRMGPPRGRGMRPPSGGGRIRISSTAEIRGTAVPRDLRRGDGPGRWGTSIR